MDTELQHAIDKLKSRISLLKSTYKGCSGCILVIGGCEYYTGAPYFAATSAFLTGSELVYIFTMPESIISLKNLLPEAIVCQIKCHEWILNRVTACVVGPGLGRPEPHVCNEISKILLYLDKRNVPIVVDADAIFLSTSLNIQALTTKIITPNISEQRHIHTLDKNTFYVMKGPKDLIKWNNIQIEISENGSPKRIGGQGDILTGVIASIVSKCTFPINSMDIIASIYLGCILVRKAAHTAYKKHWKTVITRNILGALKDTFVLEFKSHSSDPRDI
ncbi:putative sugar kinase [Ordospora colligata]|uniref:ATP-dependent (S)-NAD(P)H-hydrate dehydratase n=1 Tax=Ordospora colligata OC4 TaxID=1354746 RepID=A0A0B2UM43_9MICR|nr:putative sugar kinase [Ordospora colligata OC4]KHN70050.1 putative sugar kinase [Ordospora colligata OC4]TBU16432.1 putative sugar kinase [Ordospora colligata]TBU16617.1 putative sugar kinase [Ordospora colligata]TBU19190.1 putative sugar kinase [Ordospora colligata]